MRRSWHYRFAKLGLVMLFALPAMGQTWRQVGPLGGDVQSLAAVPGGTQTLFIGTSDGHVFGSHDSGEKWEQLGRIGANHDDVVMSILVDPRSESTLFATSWTLSSQGGGVYRSMDAGHTWQLIGLGGHAVRAIAAAPSNPDILVAGAIDGVYRSTDAGNHWTRISPEKHEDLRNFDSIAIDPRDANTIYAGTFHLPWKTMDGGKNWAPVHQGMVDDSDVMSITLDQSNPSHVFASACSGIYHSADGGASWAKFKGIPTTSRRTVHILQDPKRPLTVYAATTEGLWKTSDDGASWHMITPVSWSILSMIIDPVNPDRLILGTERLGVQISENGGQTYHAANQGFAHRRIVDAAADPQHPERALVVLTSNFEPLLETRDSGHTWMPLSTGLKSGPPRHIFASPDGWFAAPMPGGLMRYDATKNSWVDVSLISEGPARTAPARTATVKKISATSAKAPAVSPAPVMMKSVLPLRARVNDMAFGRDAWYAATDEGMLVSHDHGVSWSATSASSLSATGGKPAMGGSSIRAVRASSNDSYVWALTAHAIEISGDAGKTWISHTLPFEPRGPVHFHPSDESTVVLASDHGVFVSRDAGESWRQTSLSELLIEDMTPVRNAIVLSTAKGVLFLSRDAGRTWRHMDGPSTDSNLSALRSREAGNQLVAASSTEGLFILDMGAMSLASADPASASPVNGQQ